MFTAPKSALNADEPLPVMFWIHGGANLTGSSQTEEGAYLASSQNVVVVSANYRLGLLGWFRHASLRATAENEADASGNFAALDLIAALQWVQSNIKNLWRRPLTRHYFWRIGRRSQYLDTGAIPLGERTFSWRHCGKWLVKIDRST